MKLTLKIKLLPTGRQFDQLLETLKEANSACNAISEIAWEQRIFQQFKLHKVCYYNIKESFKLSSQVIVRAISKVVDSYKIDKKIKRVFKPLGSISYDSRILTYKANQVSIWTVEGREKMLFVCHNQKYLPYIKGEADLVYKNDKFYLFQTVEVPEEDIVDVEDFIGMDFGITDIAVTSSGQVYSNTALQAYREKRQKIRSSLQRKGTKGAKKLLKRLSERESRTATITNHTISKAIVAQAKLEVKGVSIENLKGIRKNSKRKSKKFRTKLNSWPFFQLRGFIEYKAKLQGVKVVVINPRYTSQTCNECFHIGRRNNKVFQCENSKCKVDSLDADLNAARVISLYGAAINQPEKSSICSCAVA